MLRVAIDGPAGSGKSSVAQQLAQHYGLQHISTGALYRALAYVAQQQQIAADNAVLLAECATTLKVDFVVHAQVMRIKVSGVDVTEVLRSPSITAASALVSTHAEVRQALLGVQQQLGDQGHDVVMEGRDIGTVVLPQAELKFFLDASAVVRAQRRYQEMLSHGHQVALAEVYADLLKRDSQDRQRAVAPLKLAADAEYIDATNLTLEQVVLRIATRINAFRQDHCGYG